MLPPLVLQLPRHNTKTDKKAMVNKPAATFKQDTDSSQQEATR
jgi:hypothetical protein